VVPKPPPQHRWTVASFVLCVGRMLVGDIKPNQSSGGVLGENRPMPYFAFLVLPILFFFLLLNIFG
jgi:hypothetical protein